MKKPFNPFYLVLLLAAVAFTVTACAFGWRAYLGVRPIDVQTATALESPLTRFLDQHGVTTLLAEVGILAAASLAAMATDRWRDRRGSRPNPTNPHT